MTDAAAAAAAPASGLLLKLNACAHIFHEPCLDQLSAHAPSKHFLQCPYCKEVYGQKTGTQPVNGTMTDRVVAHVLAGYACNTIEIRYDIQPGIQGPEHPNPGQ